MKQSEIQQRTQQIVVFKLGQEEYGLSIGQIKEVVATPPITRMPRTQSYVRGVANIRGTVIAMVDLEEKFNLRIHADEPPRNPYTLVIDSNDLKIGILVSDVPNTLSVSNEAIEQVFNSDNDSAYITGVVKLEKRLIIMIDIFKVINQSETLVLQNM